MAAPVGGFLGLWRIRVGDYGVVYAIQDGELVVVALRVAHCSVVHRNI